MRAEGSSAGAFASRRAIVSSRLQPVSAVLVDEDHRELVRAVMDDGVGDVDAPRDERLLHSVPLSSDPITLQTSSAAERRARRDAGGHLAAARHGSKCGSSNGVRRPRGGLASDT